MKHGTPLWAKLEGPHGVMVLRLGLRYLVDSHKAEQGLDLADADRSARSSRSIYSERTYMCLRSDSCRSDTDPWI